MLPIACMLAIGAACNGFTTIVFVGAEHPNGFAI